MSDVLYHRHPTTGCGLLVRARQPEDTDPRQPSAPWDRLQAARDDARRPLLALAEDLAEVLSPGSFGAPRLVASVELGARAPGRERAGAPPQDRWAAARAADGAHLASGPWQQPLPRQAEAVHAAVADGWCLVAPGAERWDRVARRLVDLVGLLLGGPWTAHATLTATGGRGVLDGRRDPHLWSPLVGDPWLEVASGTTTLDLLGGRRMAPGELVALRAGQVALPLAGPEPAGWLTIRRGRSTATGPAIAGPMPVAPEVQLLPPGDDGERVAVDGVVLTVPDGHAHLVVDVLLGEQTSACPARRSTCRLEVGALLASAGLGAEPIEPTERETDACDH